MKKSLLFAVCMLALPLSAHAITTGSLSSLPVNHPAALLILALVLAVSAFMLLRRRPAVASLLLVGVACVALWQVPALKAQLVSSFTNPAGETLPIPAVQIDSAGDIAGFELADYINASGKPLTIRNIELPDFDACFPGGITGTLLAPGAADPSPPSACAVGKTLAAGATCRVDVDTHCRAEAAAAVTLTAVNPTSGTASGSTGFTLTGANLTGATAVTFDGLAATSVNVVNNTTVTGITPAHAAGTVDVVISTPAGNATLADGYTYVAPATVTAVNPTSGNTSGGTGFTLTGTNLTGATAVTFDGMAATSFTVVNGTTVTGVTPAHAAGTVDVVISTPAGNATLVDGYTYVVPVTVTAVNPTSGTASGGTGFTLTGTNLTGATGVTFGGVAATSVNVVNSTTVTGVTPAHAPGAVDVVVSTPLGDATLANGYTYMITAVGQASGGGTIACLNGGLNNLIAATADNSTGIEWGGNGIAIGAGAQSNTDGASNTTAIVAALGNNGGTPYAAQMCSDYEVDSQGNTPCQAGNSCYNDWFVPAGNNTTATGQGDCLFTNRVAIGGFANDFYWTSTELSGNPAANAWAQDMSSSFQIGAIKVVNLSLRCVRAFTP